MNEFQRICIVGCGNMGGAMLAGWLAGGIQPSRITVVDPRLEAAPDGVTLLRDLPEGTFDALLLGVKPQSLAEVAPQLAGLVGPETVVLSILAGAEVATLRTLFRNAGAIVRIMPNLSAAIGRSPVALAQHGLDDDGKASVIRLMSLLGTPEWVPENQFDLVTALAGSGPAFVYRFIDALATASSALGLDAAQAQRLALATVDGAARLAAQSEHNPGELARRVASPGGVTQAGLDVLDHDSALLSLVKATLETAANRNAEMGREAKSVSG